MSKKLAALAYDAAKAAARFAKAKGAHDELVAAAHRAQADALEIEAQAKRRLADEYDAAQQRGEVAVAGENQHTLVLPAGKHLAKLANLGLTRKAIHEARQLRDAEAVSPGLVRRVLDERLAERQDPATLGRTRFSPVHDSKGAGPKAKQIAYPGDFKMDSQTKYIKKLSIIMLIGMIFILLMFTTVIVSIYLPAVSPVKFTDCGRSSAFAAWIALLPSLVSAAATVFYAYMFFRLQKEINDFNRNISRDNRLIEMSTQWNSLDFVRARNMTYLTITNYEGDKSKL